MRVQLLRVSLGITVLLWSVGVQLLPDCLAGLSFERAEPAGRAADGRVVWLILMRSFCTMEFLPWS